MKLFSLLLLAAFAAASSGHAGEVFYLGTYTKPGGSQGIYRYELDSETGAVKAHGLAAESLSPSFLGIHPSKKFLYTVNEAEGGGATAFAIQADGSLKELNRESTLGKGPTHLCLDHEGKNLLVANYGGGSVAVLPIRPDGSLGKAAGFMQHKGSGPDPRRQEAPHAHSVYVDRSNERALVADLGLDKVFLYKFDPARAALAPGEPPFISVGPGAGPRHLALGEKGHVYVVNEMANNVTVFAPEASGLEARQTVSTLPAGYEGRNSTAEIFLHPNGRTLYASNRGHDSIAVFPVKKEGLLEAPSQVSTGGKAPRFFGLNPSGKFLLACNQATGNVVVFKVDPANGALQPAGVEFQQAQPVCIVFLE